MKHSYILVTHEGAVQRVDSDGPITPSEIQAQVGGDFKSLAWAALMFELTTCSNERGEALGLPVNAKFKGLLGSVLIGVDERGVFRGLTDDEWTGIAEYIHHAI